MLESVTRNTKHNVTKRFRKLHVIAGLLAVVAAQTGCDAGDSGQGLDTVSVDVISDQVHGSGTKGFFFADCPIAPLVRYTGTFEPRLAPEVRIQRLDANKKPVPADRALLDDASSTRREGPPSARQRDLRGPLSQRRLRSRSEADLRTEVYVGGKELGFADIDVVATAAELKSVDTTKFVGLLKNQTLPIEFPYRKSSGQS